MLQRNAVPIDVFEAIADRFRVLADATRLRILHTLAEKESNVGEIISRTGLEQANVSKHLALLLKEGIVGRRKEGLFAYYRIVDKSVFRLCTIICKGLEKKTSMTGKMLRQYRKSELFHGDL